MIYVGFDNGLEGAAAALNSVGWILEVLPMPTAGLKKGNEVSPVEIVAWLDRLQATYPEEQITLLLEVPGKFAKGRMALTSMWDSFGVLRTVALLKGYRHHRVPPQRWQARMLPGCETGDTKPAALRRAKQLWPEYVFPLLKPKGKSVIHHGVPDALLIAEYGRLERL